MIVLEGVAFLLGLFAAGLVAGLIFGRSLVGEPRPAEPPPPPEPPRPKPVWSAAAAYLGGDPDRPPRSTLGVPFEAGTLALYENALRFDASGQRDDAAFLIPISALRDATADGHIVTITVARPDGTPVALRFEIGATTARRRQERAAGIVATVRDIAPEGRARL